MTTHKLMIGGLLLSLFVAVTVAQNCSNPLLNRPDIVERFGGDANVNSVSGTARSDIPVCQYLRGKPVCVNTIGFTALEEHMQEVKNTFLADGIHDDTVRFGSILSKAGRDMNKCIPIAVNYWTFLTTYEGLQQQIANDSVQVSFKDSWGTLQNSVYKLTQSYNQTIPEYAQYFMGILKALPKDKATCANSIMQHYMYVTCLAADASWSNKILGTSENPNVQIQEGFCETVADNCADYISDLKIAGLLGNIYDACADFTSQRIATILQGNWSTNADDELNSLYETATVRANLSDISQHPDFPGLPYPPADDYDCVTVGANQQRECNFVCDNVLTAIGFRQETFTNLNPELMSVDDEEDTIGNYTVGNFTEVNDVTLARPDFAIAADDYYAPEEPSYVFMGSAASLLVNLSLLVLIVVAFVF